MAKSRVIVTYKPDGTKVIKYKERKSYKGFKVGDEVILNSRVLRIHSFSLDGNFAYLKKYRKDGKMDARDHGCRVRNSELKRNK